MSEKSNSGLGGLIWIGIGLGALVVVGLGCLLIWRMFWVTMVDNYEMGFCYNRLTGKIEVVSRTGWIVRTPIINSVHTIDLRPYQISIVANIQRNAASASGSTIGSRILNAKLVRFNPKGLETFIEWHGRNAGDSLDDMLEILKAYAFNKDEGRDCPFLTVVSEIAPKPGGQASTQPGVR